MAESLTATLPQVLPARFRSKIAVQSDGCWLWTASLVGGGYGQYHQFRDGKHRSLYAHRVAYEYIVGPIAEGLELDHLCRVRACVNPDHMEAVTHRVNVRRGAPCSMRIARTHCPQGHPYSGQNLYVSKRGERVCRECRQASVRVWQARRKAAA